MYKFKNRIEPFAIGYLEADSEYVGYKIACGIRERAKYADISINPEKVFVGEYDKSEKGVQHEYGYGIHINNQAFENEIEQNPQYREELETIKEQMQGLDTYALVNDAMTDLQKKQMQYKVCHGGDWGGHSNPIYFLSGGTKALKEKIKKYRKINADKDDFYDAAVISAEALEILAERYKTLAYKMADEYTGKNKERLLRIAGAFENIPQNEPRNFFEACQMFWLLFTLDGYDSPGRFDQTLIKYYRLSGEAEREECLEALWQLFHDSRTWNLCISGSDKNGTDQTNELSYHILRVAQKYKYQTPNLTMRVHKNTPKKLLELAVKTIATGIGMPVLYNDDCVCPALEKLGISPEDSHNYCMNGCNQFDIYGKSHMGLEDGEVCLAKCLQLTLSNGICSISGEQLGIKTGNPTEFKSFEQFFDAYKKQVEAATDSTVDMANVSQKIFALYAPNPHRSNLIEGCLEKGLDFKNQGPLYGHGQILAEGIADTVDSLVAVKHFVYDTKKYAMFDLLKALERDFEGYEQLYFDFKTYKKFGNDCSETDEIYKQVTEHFYSYLLTKKTFRGGVYGGGCSPFSRAAAFGKMVGALPNGKKKTSSLLADSIGAVPGEDVNGHTALLNSVMSVDQTLAKSGHILNLKFNKQIFNSLVGKKAFLALVKTYFENAGQQLSVTVVSAEELLDAQKNPRAHKNLIVRVGGYSDYFVNLSPELQENIIERTLLEF